ncbi:glycosyltransferase family 2 protein [Candidatus Gracilibacteria bacterium]|nr:glycosyltransferase family 2 protein [Candidatus Gracilibacteria bacterium]
MENIYDIATIFFGSMPKKLISFVIPAYKEEKNVPLLYKELISSFHKIQEKYDYEIIFVNDGSPDDTWQEIQKLCEQDKNVIGINLSRNFGHQAALTAGYSQAEGDLIISMDGDGQHPPKVAIEMIEKQEKDNLDIVYARVLDREVGWFKKHSSILYYKFLSLVSDVSIPRNVGDFRLITKQVLKEFLFLSEKDRYIRGMIGWMGYEYGFVDFMIPSRIHGTSSYTLKKMIKFATDGILNFSMAPLKLGLFLGIIMVALSLFFFGYVTVDFFVRDVPYPLYKWLVILLFGFVGLLFIFVWIIGEYIGRIYNEVRQRPLYLIKETRNARK